MRFNVLRYFLEVSKHGSVRKAAEHVHITPSAVSRHIGILESRVGAPLFERGSRGMTLTPEGEVLRKYANRLMGDFDLVKAAVDEIRGMRKGVVRIFAIEAVASSFLYPAIQEFMLEYPGLIFQVEVVGRDNNDVAYAVLREEADVGIMYKLNLNVEIDYVDEFDTPFSLLVAPSHPLASKSEISLSELTGVPVGGLPPSSASRKIIDGVARSVGANINYTLVVNSMEMAKEFARTGVGVTILPTIVAQLECKARDLVSVALTDWGLQRVRTTVCTSRGRELSPAIQAFLHLLQARHRAVHGAACLPSHMKHPSEPLFGPSLVSH